MSDTHEWTSPLADRRLYRDCPTLLPAPTLLSSSPLSQEKMKFPAIVSCSTCQLFLASSPYSALEFSLHIQNSLMFSDKQ